MILRRYVVTVAVTDARAMSTPELDNEVTSALEHGLELLDACPYEYKIETPARQQVQRVNRPDPGSERWADQRWLDDAVAELVRAEKHGRCAECKFILGEHSPICSQGRD